MANALNINKKRFGIIASIGSFSLIALLVTLLLTGTVFAAFPLAGVGGFTVKASEINGANFELYPTIGETEKEKDWVNAAVKLNGQTTIKDLNLVKTIGVDGALESYGIQKVDIVISSETDVSGNGLFLRVTGIQAVDSLFGNLTIEENTGDIEKSFILKAPSLSLTNAELNTHFLQAGNIGIGGLKVKLVHTKTNGDKVGDF